MKKASYIFNLMRQLLNSEKFVTACKISQKSFSRDRILNFQVTTLFILNLVKKSIPKEIDNFCEYCDIQQVSRSAVTQARSKLSPVTFINLNNLLVKEFYTNNNIKTLFGFNLTSVDGSMVELPSSLNLLKKYGGATNQTEIQIPMARISKLYDPLNNIILDSIIAPYNANEREMAIQHFEALKSNEVDVTKLLSLFDRGYPSLALIVYLLRNRSEFVMRCNKRFLKEVNLIASSKKKDVVVKISLRRATPAAKVELKQLFPDLDFEDTISIRVIIVTLSTGEKEILITSLLNKKLYPYKIFIKLYFNRWGIEESYKFIKSEIEIENFSGTTCHAVEQDFYASILAANARSLVALEAMEEEQSVPNSRKYMYAINKKISMEKFKNKFVEMLLNVDQNIEEFCTKIKGQIKRHLCPIRPGRTFRRVRKHPNRKFHMNQR